MSRVSRVRPTISVVSGSPGYRQLWYFGWGSKVYSTPILRYEKMSDSVGPIKEDGPLRQTKIQLSDVRLNGVYQNGSAYDYYVDYGLEANAAIRLHSDIGLGLDAIEWQTLALRARKSLNPNTPNVDLPVFLAELKDLPRLYEETFRILAKYAKRGGKPPSGAGGDASRANLMAAFGYQPLIGDLLKMFDFCAAVQKREEHLRRLANGGTRFARRLDNYDYSVDVSDNILYQTRVSVIRANPLATLSVKRQSWFTARASATIPSAGDIPRLAEETYAGLHSLSVSQVWELIPWSWLIDYFTNVGAILGAYRGGIPFEMKPPTIMVEDRIDGQVVVPGAWPHESTVSTPGPTVTYISRNREVVSILPTWIFKRPYLTARQWSILASLIAIRAKGSSSTIAS